MLGTAIGVIVALTALLGRIGSDAQWLAALGHVIVQRGAIPTGVPFASSSTAHWANAPALAELIFYGLEHAFGDRGLMVAQVLAVAAAMLVLARDARAGGADGVGVAGALLLTALGAAASLAIVRVQLFSLVLFGVLVALVRAQARAPSRGIWLAVPLLALWSNLHGAALLGLAVLLGYLLVDRARRAPLQSAAVGAASAAALCLTPALLRTVDYYHGVVTGAAAQSGQGMWGPLSLGNPLDVLLVAAGLVLAIGLWRARPDAWEWVVLAGLALVTIKADRNGVWLLFFAAPPAARGLAPGKSLRMVAGPVAVVSGLILIVALVRGPVPSGASPAMVSRAVALAHGSPVLADGSIDEQVALAGGRIWAGNPIDAFSQSVQTEYLDWLAGQPSGRRALTREVDVVLVTRGTATAGLMARTPGFETASTTATTILYERAPGATG